MALFLLHEQLTEYGTLLLFIYLGGGALKMELPYALLALFLAVSPAGPLL